MNKKFSFLYFSLFLAVIGCFGVFSKVEAASSRVTTATALTAAVAAVKPGDTITLAPGEYKISYLNLKNKSGTAAAWITIKGENGAIIKGTASDSNIIELENSNYIRLENLEITAGSLAKSIAGVRLAGAKTTNIELKKLNIHDVTGNGVSVFATDASNIKLINSQISYCADSGVYWGYPGKYVVHDSEISDNYIHHSPKDSNNNYHYGIQIKGGDYKINISRNIIHDAGSNLGSSLAVYYGRKALKGDSSADMSTISDNIIWNCRNECLTVMSDANVQKNLVFTGKYCFNFQSYSDESFSGKSAIENLVVADNIGMYCTVSNFNFIGFDQAVANTVSLVGNASYQKDSNKTAFSGTIGSINSSNNIYFGQSSFTKGAAMETDSERFVEKIGAINSPDIQLYPSLADAMTSALKGLGATPVKPISDINAISLEEARLILSQTAMSPLDAAHQNVYKKITDKQIGLTTQFKNSLTFFLFPGTNSTRPVGGGERGGVVNSFKSAFGRWPTSELDWQDVIKIGNGRWPSQKSPTAEAEAKKMFKKVWLREANMNQPNDNAAVTVITYGLRMATRRPDSEKAAILTFKKIFKYSPTSARDWDIVRAIAYSGATR